jgi:hypothetical protein
MLTPKQQQFLDRISQLPGMKEAIQRLDLTPVKSQQLIISQKIENKVQGWIHDFTQLKPRVIIRSSSTPQPFMSDTEIKSYIQTIIPQPWTYPLQTAPF